MSFLQKPMPRQEFLKTCMRNLTFALVSFLGLFLAYKKRDDKNAHVCINDGLCHGCGKYDGCILPRAISAKEANYTNQRVES